jgi:hypothetical protein
MATRTETWSERQFRKALNDQYNAALKEVGRLQETSVGLIAQDEIRKAYEKVWGRVSLEQAKKAQRAVRGFETIVDDRWKAKTLRYMQDNLGVLIQEVWTESRALYLEAVRDAVATATNEGLSIEATQRRIRKLVNGKLKGDINIWRARRIAQTEVRRAGSYATFESFREMEAEGGARLVKVWNVNPGAKNPRHTTYPGLDRQEREMNKPFDVGGSALMYPGDPGGPASETIACRCFMTAKLIDELEH